MEKNTQQYSTTHGIITNVDKVCEIVNRMAEAEYSSKEIMEMINKSSDVEYISRSGQACNDKVAGYKLIKLPEFEAKSGYPIYISLHKLNSGYQGFFTGTRFNLIRNITSRVDKFEEATNDMNDLMYELYGRLLDKEYWKDEEGNVGRLTSYLFAILNKCVTRRNFEDNVLVQNDTKSKICFNTKLLDKYGNFIYMACNDVDEEDDTAFLHDASILVSCFDFSSNGFDYRNKPQPVSFFSHLEDVIFKGNISDFDLADNRRLDHLTDDSRVKRLPLKCQNMSAADLSDCVVDSVERALKMLVTDYRYIVPMYNVKEDNIQFMLPFCLDRRYAEISEVALIIGVDSRTGLYVVRTLLPIDSAYINSRTISASTSSWLERGMAALVNRNAAKYNNNEE